MENNLKEVPQTRYYKYKSTTGPLKGCEAPENQHLLFWKNVRVPAVHNHINDAMFIEWVTGDFVLDLEDVDPF